MPASIIVAGQYPAGDRISHARPKTFFARIKISVVFVKQAAETECNCSLNRILTENVGKPLAVSRGSLLPLCRLILPLVESRRKSGLQVPQRVDHCLHVNLRSLALSQRLELAGLLGPGHIQIVEEVVNGSAHG